MSLLHFWNTQRLPVKRRRTDEDASLHTSSSRGRSDRENEETTDQSLNLAQDTEYPREDEPPFSSQTDLETSLPTVETGDEAIEKYEARPDGNTGFHDSECLQRGRWKKGKSSIYVDAFNLTLETVLDEEAHLFNEAEMEVFRQWKELSYESQYL